MKVAGLLGGMSWESTITYYQILNTVVKETLGGLHSAKCLLYSVDFQELEKCLAEGDWKLCASILSSEAKRLERGGADFLLICTNTMHKVADEIQAAVSIPLVHIAEVTADTLLAAGVDKVGLLGTKYTMEQDFYKSRLIARGIEVLIPDEAERDELNRIIFKELCLGECTEKAKRYFLESVERLAASGAQGVILGCTEIGLLITQEDTPVPLFDTTRIHATQAALLALKK